MLVQDSSYSNASTATEVDFEIMAVMLSGFVPVEMFNRLESPITEEPEASISEPLFGENVKDAIRITKEWLSSRD